MFNASLLSHCLARQTLFTRIVYNFLSRSSLYLLYNPQPMTDEQGLLSVVLLHTALTLLLRNQRHQYVCVKSHFHRAQGKKNVS